MAFDDLPLRDHVRAAAPAVSRSTAPSRWIVLGAAAVIAGAALAWWWLSRDRPIAAPPAASSTTDVAVVPKRPNRQQLDLPPLDASDALLARLVSSLSAHPLATRLAATTGLARVFTLTVVQIGDGRTPSVGLQVLRPTDRLRLETPTGGRIDPASYRRWDAVTSALVSINIDEMAQVYVNVKPLIDQAYRDLGRGSDFDEAVIKAIQTLERTPTVATEPVLVKRPSYFEYEDPTLIALQPVQKQFVLMGPDNRRRILAWLRQLAVRLDLQTRG